MYKENRFINSLYIISFIVGYLLIFLIALFVGSKFTHVKLLYVECVCIVKTHKNAFVSNKIQQIENPNHSKQKIAGMQLITPINYTYLFVQRAAQRVGFLQM